MSSADRFKSYAPDVQAVVRLEEALPPKRPVHVFVDLVRSVDLGHKVRALRGVAEVPDDDPTTMSADAAHSTGSGHCRT